MRAGLTASLFTLGFALQQVAATGWTDYDSFSCPSNTKNECGEKQQKGYDWKDLPTGHVDKYDDFQFSGFTCQDSFDKRDSLTKRTFNSKCIKGVAKSDDDDDNTQGNHPKISCSDKKFSIDQLDISVDYDTDVEFHYKMEDGSSCKHVAPCQAKGSSVKNTQCGGAKEVTVKLPKKQGGKDCGVGIHSIKFNCETPPPHSTKPASSTTSSSAQSTTSSTTTSSSSSTAASSSTTTYSSSVTTTPYTEGQSTTSSQYTNSSTSSASTTSTATTQTSSSAGTSSSSSSSTSSSSSSSTSSSTSAGTSSSSSSSTSSSYSTTPTTNNAEVSTTSSSTYTTPSVGTTAISTPVTTVVTYLTVTTCDVTSLVTSGSVVSTQTTKTVSTVQVTYSTVLCNKCSMQTVSPSGKPEKPEKHVVPGSTCPELLPRCLNTWIFSTNCFDNADSDCYCKLDGFTNNVVGCVQAWGSDDELQNAIAYFAGICAKYIHQNPAIITAIPTTITCGYTAPAATGSAAPAPTVPLTTITASVPCMGASAAPTCTTTVVVPQVSIVKQPQADATLYPGVPANVPANPTSQSSAAAGTGTAKPTSPVTPFTGAAASTSSFSAVVFASFIGLLALAFQL